MGEQRIPDYAPGQELTLHPIDLDPRLADEEGYPRPRPVAADQPAPARRPGRDAERVNLVALFDEISSAKACADDLEQQGIETALVFRDPGREERAGEGAAVAAEPDRPGEATEMPRETAIGSGVTVGATLGATIGLVTATFMIPPFGTLLATGSLLGTLTGAGIGSFLGGMVENGIRERDDAPRAAADPIPAGGVMLIARADPSRVDEVRQDIDLWSPVEIRVR